MSFYMVSRTQPPSSAPPRHSVLLRCVLVCLALLLLPLQQLGAAPSAEYQLKAALIYKLSKYVTWPGSAFSETSRHFGICVLGEDPFGSALDALEKRRTVNRYIRIYRFARSDDIDQQCQIVFIDASRRAFLQPILQHLRQQPILTASDIHEFAKEGGIMELTRKDKGIGFTINLTRAREAGLEIAAPLLELATIVESHR